MSNTENSNYVPRRTFLKQVGAATAAAGLATALGPTALTFASSANATLLPPPNNGAPITITIWSPWAAPEPHFALFNSWAAAYHKIYPNVTIKQVALPWDLHWTKLQAATASGTGPDIDAMHIAYYSQFYDDGLLSPYPDALFPKAELAKEYSLFPLSLAPDGNQYCWPEDAAVPMFLYNKAIWAKAGLTDKDFPKTWDDVARLAKHLTISKNGVKTQYGYSRGSFPPSWFVEDVYLQQGAYLYSPDATKAIFNNDAMVEAILLDKKLVGAYGSYTGSADAQLGTGQVAMMRGWAWMIGNALTANPNAQIGALPLPNLTGKPGPYGQGVLQVGLGVMAKIPAARRETAFHFLHWVLRGSKATQNSVAFAATDGGTSTYKPAAALFNSGALGHDVTSKAALRAVYFQDFPPAAETALNTAVANVELKGANPRSELDNVVKVANHLLRVRRIITSERVKLG